MNYSDIITNRVNALGKQTMVDNLKPKIKRMNKETSGGDLGFYWCVSIVENRIKVCWDRLMIAGNWETDGEVKYHEAFFNFDEWAEVESLFLEVVNSCEYVCIK